MPSSMPDPLSARPLSGQPAATVRRRPAWRLLSCDHKAIGTLNLGFAILAGLVGAALSLMIHAEAQEPGLRLFADAATFGVFVSVHGLVMVLLMVVPALIGGFGSWFVPIMISAQDMAFPRLNAVSFWLLPPSMGLMLMALFAAPALVLPSTLALAALAFAGLSSLLQAINFIVTIFNMRAPGTGFAALPLFVWSVLVTAFVLLLSWPAVAGALTYLLMTPAAGLGGDPARLKQVTWFIAHPEIYVLILPGLGVISQIVATFARRPVRGFLWVVAAMVSLGLAGFFLWARYLYDGGMTGEMQGYFLPAALVVALAAFVQIAAWGVTLAGGLRLSAPMLWALGFIVLLAIGVVTGVELAGTGLGATGFGTTGLGATGGAGEGVAHFHYVLSLSAVFAIFAGWYFWFPKMTGLMCSERLAKLHFWLAFAGVNLVFLPLHLSAMAGRMPAVGGVPVALGGAVLSVAGIAVFLAGIAVAFLRAVPAGDNPWGAGATSPEWQVASPPPVVAFDLSASVPRS